VAAVYELCNGKRSAGSQHKRYKDVLKVFATSTLTQTTGKPQLQITVNGMAKLHREQPTANSST